MTTLDDFAVTTVSPTNVRTVSSFWRRFISSLESHRQRQANQHIAEFLRRHPEYQEDFVRFKTDGVR
jgi:hypothetical protein